MPAKSFAATAAVVLAAIRLASAASELRVKNSCQDTVVMDKCQNGDFWLPELAPGDTSDPQPFDPTTSGGTGVSYKLFPKSQQDGQPMQFEYSAGGNDGQVWFDLSNINGYPQMFVDGGVTVVPDGTGSNCQEIICPAGKRECTNAYNQPHDDQKAMRNCDNNCKVLLHLCSGGKVESGGGDDSSSGGNNTPAPVAYTPSSTFVTSASQAPPPPQYNNEGNKMLQENENGGVGVPQDNKYVATTVVYSQETEYVQAGQRMHRRHNHGHAHHHHQ